jgi:hypothetical protein
MRTKFLVIPDVRPDMIKSMMMTITGSGSSMNNDHLGLLLRMCKVSRRLWNLYTFGPCNPILLLVLSS